MNKELQKLEALERMKMLAIYPNTIKEFKKENIVNLSENNGMLYWLSVEQKTLVEQFENKYNTLVYHVIHNYTEFGELLSFLYVSKEKEEWVFDREELKEGYPCAYVENLDEPTFSEFGCIGIKSQYGGLIRTA